MNALSRFLLIVRLIPLAIIGYMVPLRTASFARLSDELRRNGIPPWMIPSACLHEIADEVLQIARLQSKRGNRGLYGEKLGVRALMDLGIEFQAELLTEVLTGKAGRWDDKMRRDGKVHLASILAKHGVPIP